VKLILPLLNPPPSGRGGLRRVLSIILPLPLGGGGYRWGEEVFSSLLQEKNKFG